MEAEIIQPEDTEWPWPDFPRGQQRNYHRQANEKLTGWEGDFLDYFRRTGYQREAARHARVSLSLVAKRQKDDNRFAEAFEEARKEAAMVLYGMALQRATVGVEKKKQIYKRERKNGRDEMVLDREERTVEVSDQLLIRLLEANDPERFGRRVDHRHSFAIIQEEAKRIAAQRNLDPERIIEVAKELLEDSNK